ncbi:MAG: hypothetical protein QXY50_02210 [Candidatus Caldarchaeum sp.]
MFARPTIFEPVGRTGGSLQSGKPVMETTLVFSNKPPLRLFVSRGLMSSGTIKLLSFLASGS